MNKGQDAKRNRGEVVVDFAMLLTILVIVLVVIINLGMLLREPQVPHPQSIPREASRASSSTNQPRSEPQPSIVAIQRHAANYLAWRTLW